MSVVDLRCMRNAVIQAKARFKKHYPTLRKEIEEYITLSEDSERFYSTSDNVRLSFGVKKYE